MDKRFDECFKPHLRFVGREKHYFTLTTKRDIVCHKLNVGPCNYRNERAAKTVQPVSSNQDQVSKLRNIFNAVNYTQKFGTTLV